jgi:hypothetical protein
MRHPDPVPEHSVLVFDMARTGEPDGERTVRGFRNLETAQAYAQARVRASVEELRKPGIGAAELATFGISMARIASLSAMTIAARIGFTIISRSPPRLPTPTGWRSSLSPGDSMPRCSFQTRTRTQRGCCSSSRAHGGQALHDLMDRFGDAARRKLHDKGVGTIEPLTLHIGSLFELPKPPDLPGNPGKPLKNWRITVEFVCHDVKFGATVAGVFAWPTEPDGAIRDQMVHVAVCDAFAMRDGDGRLYRNPVREC